MNEERIALSIVLPASCERLYQAWLSSAEHSAFTGSPAHIEPGVGGAFTAWGGYISGRNLELEPPRRIQQAWRTTEFPVGAPDSRLELLLERVANGSRLTLVHTGIPAGQAENYRKGWDDFYFTPMRAYFS